MGKVLCSTAVALSILLASSTASAIPSLQKARDEAAKEIRQTAYEMMKAFLTQDVVTFKRHSAKRTLDLVDLVYQAARQDPNYQQELKKANITNSEQFLSYFMLGMANQYLQSMPLSPEAAATRVARDSTITFVNDSEARIAVADSGFARAKRVARVWKIDLADWLKRAVLNEIKNPEMRARIKSL